MQKNPLEKVPKMGIIIIFAHDLKNGENICKEHIKRLLGEAPGLRAIFKNLV